MKIRNYIAAAFIGLVSISPAFAYNHLEAVKADPYKASNLFRPYPEDEIDSLTPAPRGYRPFYISHYGRHGSRWLLKESDYEIIERPFREAEAAGTLTPKGKQAYEKVKLACEQAVGQAGSLSPLGTKQHQGIAERMFRNFPDVLAKDAKIDARATLVMRCPMSMIAFCDRLKEKSPKLKFTYEASVRTTGPLYYTSDLAYKIDPEYTDFCANGEYLTIIKEIVHNPKKFDAAGLTESLFGKQIFATPDDEYDFMCQFFYLAEDLQNVMPELEMWDIFTTEQLYWMSVAENFRSLGKRGPHSMGAKWNLEYAKRLLTDIVERCDNAVAGNGNDADLRFGHDMSFWGLTPLMCLNGYDKYDPDPEEAIKTWNVYEMTPMAANLQFIFYRPVNNPKGEVLVKILHNEKESTLPVASDCWPYYKWTDVRAHFQNRLDTKF